MHYNVEATLDALGIEGRVSGDELTALCPMHRERTGREDNHPSWSINLSTGLFICFSCGYRGSLLTLIADMRHVSLDEAKHLTVKPDLMDSVARVPGAYTAVSPPEPMSESRLYRFGTPPTWARRRRHLSLAAVTTYGIRWDWLNESWIIPIRETGSGKLLGWQEKSETERIFRNYPTGVKKSRCLFGYEAFPGGRLVVVESPLDAVRIWSEGIGFAVATYGAVVSRQQLHMLSAADEVIFALDNPYIDNAGQKAARQLLTESRGILRSVRFFDYRGTDAKDPGDMTRDEITRGIEHARSRAYGEKAIAS